MNRWLVFLILLMLAAPAYASAADKEVSTMEGLRLSSPAFTAGAGIPARYTCDGSDTNPALVIDQTPAAARSLALIMEDPDAPMGTWVHWLVWNIPPQTRQILEDSVPAGANAGRNSWKRNTYGGPCPPSGTHRYFFKLYALDTELTIPLASTKADLERAMHGHILATGELMGTYRRQ